ncbi:hypothetical protein [Streptomyces sp. NPDC096323]|uniref:hypothetical protein n=1 Tax=Streptomyces sp. NPDC096323 TaxID=3155822 RepID=UPI00332ADE0A
MKSASAPQVAAPGEHRPAHPLRSGQPAQRGERLLRELHLLGDVFQHVRGHGRGQVLEGGGGLRLGEQVATPGEDAVAVDGLEVARHMAQPGHIVLAQRPTAVEVCLHAGEQLGSGRSQGRADREPRGAFQGHEAADEANAVVDGGPEVAAEAQAEVVVDGVPERGPVRPPFVHRLYRVRQVTHLLMVGADHLLRVGEMPGHEHRHR